MTNEEIKKLTEKIRAEERKRIVEIINKLKVSGSEDILKYFAESVNDYDTGAALMVARTADVHNKLIEDIINKIN